MLVRSQEGGKVLEVSKSWHRVMLLSGPSRVFHCTERGSTGTPEQSEWMCTSY